MEEILFLGPHGSIVGVHTPAQSGVCPAQPGLVVVMLNSGLIHHVGPHRLYVKLARALAVQGVGAVRVDLSGIGDSPARPDHLPAAEQGFREPREIVDSLQALGYRQFVLLGICSGAKHALQAVSCDDRIRALVLVNQESRHDRAPDSSSGRASAQYYLRRSLRNPQAWLNLLTGRVKYRALFASLVGEIRRRVHPGRQSQATPGELFRKELEPALEKHCDVLLLLSDRHAKYVGLFADGVQQVEGLGCVRVALRTDADHLFTARAHREFFVHQVCSWIAALGQEPAADASTGGAPPLRACGGD